MVGADADATPRQLYRVVAVDPNNPSRSAVRYHDAGAAAVVPPPVHQFQTSGYGGRGGGSGGGGGDQRPPLSPDSAGPRLVSYSIHPVGSETDFARPRAVYSSEWHAPMNRQFPGGPGTCCSPTSGGWVPVTADNPSYEPRLCYVTTKREREREREREKYIRKAGIPQGQPPIYAGAYVMYCNVM